MVLPQYNFVILYKKGISNLLSVYDLVFCVNLIFCNNFIVFACVQNDTGLLVKGKSKQIYIAIKLIKPLC